MFYVANSTDENLSTWSRLIGTRNWNESTETKFKKLKGTSISSFSAKLVPQVKKNKTKQKAKKNIDVRTPKCIEARWHQFYFFPVSRLFLV